MRASPNIRFPWIAFETWFHRFANSVPATPPPPRFGLVLSCGGARGLAHVGAIQVLEEAGVPISVIVGSSMGAYVGALWAAGVDGSGLEKLAAEIKDRRTLLRLIDPIFPPVSGFLRGDKVRRHLERTLGELKISDLKKKAYIIATDLDSLHGDVMPEDTSVASAVQASCAIPGVCAPVLFNGKRYIDGGAAQPLPVSLLKKLAAVDYIIAVNVMPTAEDIIGSDMASFPVVPEAPRNSMNRVWRACMRSVNLFAYGNVLDTFKRCLTAAQLRLISDESAAADVLVHPFFNESKWYDFENSHRYVEAGRNAMLAALPRIKTLAGSTFTPKTLMKTFLPSPPWDAGAAEFWQSWQLRRLREYLKRRVLPFSEHYRRLFETHDIRPDDIRSMQDWNRVPLSSKDDLTVSKERQRDFVLVPDQRKLRKEPRVILHTLFHGIGGTKEMLEKEFRPILLTSTTGRSSEPVPFLYTKHDLANLEISGRRLMEVCASDRGYRHLNLFPYAPHLAFWQAHHAGLGFGTFVLSTGGGKTLGTEGNIALIERIRPDVLIGMPTFIYHVLRQAVEEKRHWPQLKRLTLGGEKISQGLRAKLRELTTQLGSLGVHVMGTYAFTEAKMAWPECPTLPHEGSSGFHLYPDLGLVELINPQTGDPVPHGVPGEIVFTPLDARGTVVLRYRTGDIAEGGLTWEACPHCGRKCPRLLGPISRVSEKRVLQLDKVKGTIVDFNVLEHLLDDLRGIAAWQIELRKLHDDPHECDEVLLHAAAENGSNEGNLREQIARRFHEVTELRPNAILFHSVSEMRNLLGIGRLIKEEKIADHRKPSSATASGTAQPNPNEQTALT